MDRALRRYESFCNLLSQPGARLPHIGHTGHWCQLYKVLDHHHQIRSLYLQLLLQWLHSFSIHGRWSPADLPNWSESSNADRQVTFDDEQGLEKERRGLINKTEYVDPYISTIYLNTIGKGSL